MRRQTRVSSLLVMALAALTLVGLGVGCEPIDRSSAAPVSIVSERLPDPASLPAEYGRLVDVTTTPGYREDFAQLWFVDDEGTIRCVYYHFRDRALDQRVDVIPRAGMAPQPAPLEEDEEVTP